MMELRRDYSRPITTSLLKNAALPGGVFTRSSRHRKQSSSKKPNAAAVRVCCSAVSVGQERPTRRTEQADGWTCCAVRTVMLRRYAAASSG
jgi:hypothetical protein